MKKAIAAILLIGGINSLVAQSEAQLNDKENQIICVVHKSSKCKIFYGNGSYEEVKAEPLKKSKITGIDPEDQNIARVVNKILSHEWELKHVASSGATQMQTGKPTYFYFVRKE